MERKGEAVIAAGGRAGRAAKRPGCWTTAYLGPRGKRKRAVLKSPDGRVFEGTREEVRRSGLLPAERQALAVGLCASHMAFRDDPDTLREQSALRRRDAIQYHASKARREDAALEVMAGAAARFAGKSVAEFKRDAVLGAIEAAMSLAKSKRGSFELPLTRQERAALEGLGRRHAEFCPEWRLEEALRR